MEQVYDPVTNKTYLGKTIYCNKLTNGVPSSLIREVSILKELEHENIVRLMRINADTKLIILHFELMDCNLRSFISERERGPLHHRLIKTFLPQILSGVAYCHSHNILHRDLKTENILVDILKRKVKLANFGSSREVGVPRNTYTKKVATLQYSAPEILLGEKRYSYSMDMWGVGCIFAEMAMNKQIFGVDQSEDFDQITKIFSILGTPDEDTWPGVTKLHPNPRVMGKFSPQDLGKLIPHLANDRLGLDLLSKMLCLDPSKRITAHDALRHRYIRVP